MPLSELNNGHVVVLPEGEECDWAYENRTCGHKLHPIQGRIQGGALGAEAPPFIFRLYLINMLSIIMKFCLSIII